MNSIVAFLCVISGCLVNGVLSRRGGALRCRRGIVTYDKNDCDNYYSR